MNKKTLSVEKRAFESLKIFFEIFLCLLILLSALPSAAMAEEYNTIYISTAYDFINLSGKCTLDTWSVGKTVYLSCDIDLTGNDFEPIPQFAGIFDGGGHTISGFSVTDAGSTVGLFRKVLEGGTVENLNVTGTVTPEGTKKTVGGVVGENRGTIKNCTFDGTVFGGRCVGGIAGSNTSTGLIQGCGMYGQVSGEHRVGGIAGENLGVIMDCENTANVNIEYLGTVQSEEIDLSLSAEELIDITDIGGVTGFSSGAVTDCVNSGNVGYQHVGYNVGGVVGRQSGYISGCINLGTVLGRKDVGGIAGQIDPEARWSFSGSAFDELKENLDSLSTLIDKAYSDVNASAASLGENADSVISAVGSMESAAQALTLDAESWINSNLETVNELSERISYTLSAMHPICDDMTAAFDDMADAVKELSNAFSHLSDAEEDLSDGTKSLIETLEDVQYAMDNGRNAAYKIRGGLEHLDSIWSTDTPANEAFSEISAGFTELAEAMSQLIAALASAKTVRGEHELEKTFSDFLGSISESMPDLSQELAALAQAVGDISAAIGNINVEFRPEEFSKALSDFKRAIQSIGHMIENMEMANADLQDTLTEIDNGGDDIKEALLSMEKASKTLGTSLKSLKSASDKGSELIESLASEPALKFTLIDTESSAQQELFTALEEINTSVNALTQNLTDTTILRDLEDVTDGISEVIDCIVAMFTEVNSVTITDYAEDVSAKGTSGHTAGTLTSSQNYGDVTAYTNVGGIAGAVTIDISFDLEDELNISSILSSGAKYVIYAAVYGCENSGAVTADKSAAGGVVGRMDYGAVLDSESGGEVRSAGSYAGGIAGYSTATVNGCRARANISGESYVGGIAGLGCDIKDCLAMPHFESKTEFMGAIAGFAEGELSGNFYSECTIGAVDGFSYSGKAEEAEYSELLSLSGNDDLFAFVTVTFIKDGEVYEEMKVALGDGITELPQIGQEGETFWKWDSADLSEVYYNVTVYGEYFTPLSTIATGENIPLFLAEGTFYGGQELMATPFSPDDDSFDDEVIAAYTITVSGYEGELKIRMRTDKTGTLYRQNPDGGYTELSYEIDGSYIVFEIENGDSIVLTECRSVNPAMYIITAVVIVVCILILVKKKKVKRKILRNRNQ